jgi:hypothetical protein
MKIEVLYQPTYEYMDGNETKVKTLQAQDSYEKAEELLKTHLMGKPGANGQVEKFYVCVDETVQVVSSFESEPKLILPNYGGNNE